MLVDHRIEACRQSHRPGHRAAGIQVGRGADELDDAGDAVARGVQQDHDALHAFGIAHRRNAHAHRPRRRRGPRSGTRCDARGRRARRARSAPTPRLCRAWPGSGSVHSLYMATWYCTLTWPFMSSHSRGTRMRTSSGSSRTWAVVGISIRKPVIPQLLISVAAAGGRRAWQLEFAGSPVACAIEPTYVFSGRHCTEPAPRLSRARRSHPT